MKKRLLSALASLLFCSALMNAQTTTWNFSSSAWPATSGYATNTVTNNLGFIPGPSTSSSLVGQVEGNTSTIDDISFTQRMKLNGGSYVSGTTDFSMPTQRVLYFDVTGASTIKLWYKNGGGNTRTVYVTNGTSVLASFPYTDSTVGQVATVNYTGAAGRIYVAADQSINFYQITATNVGTTPILAIDSAVKNSTKVYAAGKQVFVSKVAGTTHVEVYTMNGALVKTLNTKSDTSFELQNKGVYIVNVKSNNTSVSQKVLIK